MSGQSQRPRTRGDRRREVTRLRDEGLTLQAIADRLGVSKQAVQQMLKRIDASK